MAQPDLLTITVQTSVSPPVTLRASDFLAPRGPSNPAAELALSLLRPKITITSDLLGDRVIVPYGEPFGPWWLGLALLVGGLLAVALAVKQA